MLIGRMPEHVTDDRVACNARAAAMSELKQLFGNAAEGIHGDTPHDTATFGREDGKLLLERTGERLREGRQ